ncbi:MAG: type II toxin-antitoxin system Phd/YefM family antitoxin [Nitrospirota bacterium]|nr:type II toxin-antitoxin system Phd/YefM family antitoxin [Nitrospirota bacterium]
MKTVPLSEIKDDLSRFLREAEKEDIVVTRHGKPAGLLVGFASEDDWLDYRLENDPGFLERISAARESLRSGKGKKLEDIEGLTPRSSRRSRG